MAARDLKNHLTDFLYRLHRDKDDKRYTFQDLADKSHLSRTTIYNWMRGKTTPTDRHLDNLAGGMLQLLLEAHPSDGNIDTPNKSALKSDLRRTFDHVDTNADEVRVGFIRYSPVCDATETTSEPTNREENTPSTFLGSLIKNFDKMGGLARTDDRKAVLLPNARDISYLDLNECDILVGLFLTQERIPRWNFIRTPIQMSINAVLLRRDIGPFLQKIMSTRKKTLSEGGVDNYICSLKNDFWLGRAGLSSRAASILFDLAPITANEEIGRDFLKSAHDFTEDSLEKFAQSSLKPNSAESDRLLPTPDAFFEALQRASSQFQDNLKAQDVFSTSHKLPAVVADELTAFEIIRYVSKKLAHETDPVLLIPPTEVLRSQFDFRPRFSVSIAMLNPGQESNTDLYDATRRRFEDFLWSNTAVIAKQYVRLYFDLLERFWDELGPASAVYFLRWLSIDITLDDLTSAPKKSPSRNSSSVSQLQFSLPPDTEAWAGVLRAAKVMILDDLELREKLSNSFCSIEQGTED